ncbi:MAG TPA: 7-carboxy-7-deazaguanine synthase QueE, partial [Chryseosolibacter sp.]
GCDVGCVWCDVKESWDASAHPVVSVAEITRRTKASGAPVAVITGGEPMMYDLTDLTQLLKDVGIRTHLETSGVYAITGSWNWICFSPKKFKAPDPSVPAQADELKIIVYNQSDFDWAEKHAAFVGEKCELFLQPEWSREKEMLPLVIEYVKAHPRWKISLQIHKYMNIP